MPCDKHPSLAVGPCGKCGRLKCPVCACDACVDQNDAITPLRVASWNIKTLGKQFHHNQPAVTKLLAAVMLRMNADVICLMEVMEGFGLKHAVSIVEEMKKISTIRWRVRFPGTYTGTGGRNGLETYAVVYNPDLFELVSFKLVGAEIPYSKDKSGKRGPDAFSKVVTRRPAEAVFRPLPTNRHFNLYPEFRVIIFHAPSVAPTPYMGLKNAAAQTQLNSSPLSITSAQATEINQAVKANALSKLVVNYDNAVGAGAFYSLPQEAQTSIASVSFQYGNLANSAPTFWGKVVAKDWAGAVSELRNFGDSYPTRRGLEADRLQQGIDNAQLHAGKTC